jgi:protein SCO1/2
MVEDAFVHNLTYEKGRPIVNNDIFLFFDIKLRLKEKFLGLFMCLIILSCMAHARQIPPSVGVSEKLGQALPMDVELYDESGNLVQLKSIINKPTIIVFVYYECPGICSPLLTEVAKIIDKMDLELGRDYQILTLSFDHNERPELAQAKKDNYLAEINKTVNQNGWRFFTGDSMNIHRFTDAAGFYFAKSGNEWIHAATLIAVSPQGTVTRYLYGIHQLPLDVKLAVMEAAEGKTGPTIAKVLNFCYAYDPEGKHYTFNFVRISGIVIVGLVALFMFVFVVRPKKKAER